MPSIDEVYGLRQTGRTSEAILNAPNTALYLVATGREIDYTRDLMNILGRNDLTVVTLARLHRLLIPVRHIVVDHHVWEVASPAETAQLRLLLARQTCMQKHVREAASESKEK